MECRISKCGSRSDSVVIPAITEAIINVRVPRKFRARTALIEPHFMNAHRLFLVAKAMVNLKGVSNSVSNLQSEQ